MIGPDSHNSEERRFVEELSVRLTTTFYLRGVGVKGLRAHQLMSIPSRLASRPSSEADGKVGSASLYIIPLRRLARSVNVRWIRRQLSAIPRAFPGLEWTLWIRFPSPELVDAVAGIRGVRVIYEPIDLYSAAEDLSPAQCAGLLAAERKLATMATVVTGGRLLANRFAGTSGGCHWLPFGTDRNQVPDGVGLERTERPRLLVVGCFDWRVDEGLLVDMMSMHPDWQLVLAGPRVRPWGRRLQRLGNVEWLGRIPVGRVRSVIRDCDVTLIPYRLTDWTRHCLPVKVFEYLAEGKPVVATPLPELALLEDAVTIAPPASFAEAVRQGLEHISPAAEARGRRAADRFTLQDRAKRAVELIQGKELQAAVR